VDSRTDEVNDFFFNLPNTFSRTRPWVQTASNRNENQGQKKMFLGGKAQPVRKADNLTAICEPIIYTMRDP
jgi:hypothetical protein